MPARFKNRMHKVPDHHSEKARLRTELRQCRVGIDARQRAVLDAAINRHLLEYSRAARLSDIAVYLPFDGEPDLTPAMDELDEHGITLALPVVHEVSGRNTLIFRQWTRNCELRPNRYGILEPAGTAEIPLLRFDVILMPLVGWDRRGSRLGMGGSYYDRALQPFTGLACDDVDRHRRRWTYLRALPRTERARLRFTTVNGIPKQDVIVQRIGVGC